MRDHEQARRHDVEQQFPFLFGGTFIEGERVPCASGSWSTNFPSFSEGLSLRVITPPVRDSFRPGNFPSFSEGLSLRACQLELFRYCVADFPSFSEGLSLRGYYEFVETAPASHFPSFSEGLSLRGRYRVAYR